MAAAASHNLDDLRAKVEAHLRGVGAGGGSAAVKKIGPLYGGACQDNFEVEVELDGRSRRFALRADAPTSLPGSIDRAQEHAVIALAVERGVKTPAVHWLARDLLRPGASAYFMDWAEGVAIGRKVLAAPELEGARARLADELAVELAKIHSIRPADGPGLFHTGLNPRPDVAPARAALAGARAGIDRGLLGDAHPALELAMGWLDAHAPDHEEVVLLHGDFRIGNLLITPAGLAAVLDWEFAHWGSPAEDLAWIAVREWRFGRIDLPVGGFSQREPFYAAYERASGRTIDRRALIWWEVLGNVRWASGCIAQGERYLVEPALELIAIPRRAAEMEWEAMRLIERAGF